MARPVGKVPEAKHLPTIGGVCHAAAVLYLYHAIRRQPVTDLLTPISVGTVAESVYVAIGLFTIGYVMVHVAVAHRRYTPLLAAVTFYVGATYTSWRDIQSALDSGVEPLLTIRLDAIYVYWWIFPLTAIVLLWVLEDLARGIVRRR
ncbi:hypothetical protein Halru_1128 [Halovivax ruber XH-70]|uniref:Uncharacterized protein n=1 Tax=Halovivax ruber (strain DSM 18193 / JCM 13892 / XH-70) TaxID=797302 RepID=L0I826_HALRX|nr:hypothetical protein [Halovivax ruber]AGB15745.1 hypothetical protein Halru_1128 [Halovivax ruber XH-70]